jgi:hypothetical protein
MYEDNEYVYSMDCLRAANYKVNSFHYTMKWQIYWLNIPLDSEGMECDIYLQCDIHNYKNMFYVKTISCG